jgi:sulfide:quinone oxidoreductase
MRSKPKIVVLGGGFAGLESAFLLRRRLDRRAGLTLVSDNSRFLFRPNLVYVPFGADPARSEVPLREAARRGGVRFVNDPVLGVEPRQHVVRLARGTLPYDYLVIATGAAMRPQEVPGLFENADTIGSAVDGVRLRGAVRRIVAHGRAGSGARVLLLVSPRAGFAGPLYETLFMLESHLRRQKARAGVRLTLASAEGAYLEAFGPKLHELVSRELAERGIEGHLGHEVEAVDPERVSFRNGDSLAYDELIALPPSVAAVRYDGLAADERGFLRVAPDNRAVIGADRVFAPGDASDFPLKQAFLALLQAEAVAEAIAGAITHEGPRAAFDPVSLYVMEEMDKGAFAQVPLRLTPWPEQPLAVRPRGAARYAASASPLWRVGKSAVGLYLPRRFRAGEAFHAGVGWKVMETALQGISAVAAG